MHPNLILSDAEKELSDDSRWMKLEPPDVTSECVGYDVENAAAANQRQAETRESKTGITRVKKESQAISMQDILEVHQALKSGADIIVGDDPWASKIIAPLAAPTEPATLLGASISPPLKPNTSVQATIAFLQREIMLLRNELNFELYLKQQHLQHIGRLHREHVQDSTVEAERQTLYNTCRTLKAQLTKTQAAFDQHRAEMTNLKSRHVRREDELNAKLKAYREEKKEWASVKERLEHELNETRSANSTQGKQLEIAEARIFSLENQRKTLEPRLEKISEYERRINQLSAQLLLWEEDTRKFQEQKRHMENLLARWRKMEMTLQADEQEINKLRATVSVQLRTIDELNAKFQANNHPKERPALEQQEKMWNIERERREKDYKNLEAVTENVKKRNEELEARVLGLLARIEALTPPPRIPEPPQE